MGRREKKTKTRGAAGMHRKSGDEFLESNKSKPDVIETASGLQYLIQQDAVDNKPDEYSTVTIHQRALLLNGTVLEDTYRNNTPSKIKLIELIEGLQEGLQLMSIGARYKFWVPSELAWGRKGTSNKIPPNAVLHFDIKLLEIE